MSLVKKLGKAIVPFVLAGSAFLGGCYHPPTPNAQIEVIDAFPSQRIESMRSELSGKKLALALITDYDYNNATEGMEGMFKEDFSDLPNYVLHTARTGNFEEIFNNLRDYSTLQPIDALILAYHGSQTGMSVNSRQRITTSNVQRLFQDYSSVFSDDAIILLYSCSTGKGETNFGTSLADVLNRDVITPKFTLIPETDLEQNKRVGEFAPDENGRLSYDFDNFLTYDKIDFKGGRYMNSLAPFSYEKVNGEKVNGRNGRDYFLFVDK